MDRLLAFHVERLARMVRKRDGHLVHIKDVIEVAPNQFYPHHVNDVLRITSSFIEVFLHRVCRSMLCKTQQLRKAKNAQFFRTRTLVLE